MVSCVVIVMCQCYVLLFTGSGIYKQQQDTYTQLTEGESVYITEDTTLVCVSSIAGNSAWYYSNISTGVEERVIDGTDVIRYKGFLTLSLQTTSRAGYYICKTLEVTDDTYVTADTEHSIIVSVPIVTTPVVTTPKTTTAMPTGPILTSSITTETITTPKTTTAGASIQQSSTLQHTTQTTAINNNTHSELEDTLPYPIIGLVAGVLVILILVIIVVILIIVFIVKRRKTNKPGYSKQLQTNNIEDTTTDVNNNNNNREYVNLQDLSIKPIPPPNTRKPVYRKLVQTDTPVSSPVKSPSEETDGYMTLEQLEGSLGAGGKSDPCVEEKVVPNDESQYENVKVSLYESTTAKYSRDPCSTLVPLSQFKSHLSHLLIESRLEKEYSQLGEKDLRYECTQALRSENSGRNKYKLIYPYDKSRVVLTSNKESDYINATYIPGFYVSDTFIVAQAPKKNTETHFWQMILEQRVSTIVMLTRVVELGKEKSTSYWPQQVGFSSNFEGIKVTLKREEISLRYVLREMEITGPNSSSYKLTQFHYVAWPDHDVPQLFMELLEFTQIIKKHHIRERTPLLVHCSAGVGRSGTFIALYNLIEAVGVEETISVYRIVNEMREYRPQMVQTLNQYKFIYLAVLEMIFGMTGVSSKDFCDTYKLYLQSHGESGDVFRQQFEELCYQSDCSFSYPQEAARDPSNLAKNAIKEVLPYDTNRVILYSPNWPCEYINASYMGSYEMIVTMLPTQETIQDFLQLVYQLEDPLVVLLFTQAEYQKVRSGASKRVCYWLEESGKKEFGEFSATTEKSQKSSFLIQQKMKVYSNYDSYEKQFSQFISLVWEDTGAVNDVVGVLTLLELITKLMLTTPGKKIVFCCNDGIGKSGVLTTLYRAVREVGECIDVFQTVKQIRSYRKDMVPTLVSQ